MVVCVFWGGEKEGFDEFVCVGFGVFVKGHEK